MDSHTWNDLEHRKTILARRVVPNIDERCLRAPPRKVLDGLAGSFVAIPSIICVDVLVTGAD